MQQCFTANNLVMEEFIVKKTIELTADEKQQILDLFNIIMEKNRSMSEFVNQNIQNPMGYSYHTLYVVDGKIVGHNAGVPSYYIVNNKRVKVICNIDTMIAKDHRGIENYYELMDTAYGRYIEDGYAMVIGFPNDNAHPLITAMKFLLDVDKLHTYCLPYRIGGVKRGFGFLNWASELFCRTWVGLTSIFASKEVKKFIIAKDDSYNKTRYKCMDGNYTIVDLDNVKFYYKVKVHEGIRTAFLIDVEQKSAINYCNAVRYIMKHEKNNFDLLLYVGELPFGCNGMIRFPRKFEPKNFFFTAKIIDEKAVDKNEAFDIGNWDVNLSNYDLI